MPVIYLSQDVGDETQKQGVIFSLLAVSYGAKQVRARLRLGHHPLRPSENTILRLSSFFLVYSAQTSVD